MVEIWGIKHYNREKIRVFWRPNHTASRIWNIDPDPILEGTHNKSKTKEKRE